MDVSEEQTPSPIIPYELIRLVAQRSPLATAARAVGLCKDGRKYGPDVFRLGYYSVEDHPDIGEMLYTTLVQCGAPPENPGLLELAIGFSHFNVVRAMAAAGVDVLRIVDREYIAIAFDDDLWNPESLKFLVEELGYEPPQHLLSRFVWHGQMENAAYLVSRGADPYAIEEFAIKLAIQADYVETLEWLLQNRADLRADEMLGYKLESRGPTSKGIWGRNGTTLFGRAMKRRLWEVGAMMLAKIDSSASVNYQLLKSIAADDESSFLPPGNPNAFNGAPLCLAALRNKIKTITLLLERGAAVTALTLRAAVYNPENIAAFLLLLPVAQNYNPISLFFFAKARSLLSGFCGRRWQRCCGRRWQRW
ncbi:hypothetical protein HK104_005089 [Borealophlyctis nickersoniae]|nr:hypothetical protein HK104_005089 [Borealophlyctis nickersoniae]